MPKIKATGRSAGSRSRKPFSMQCRTLIRRADGSRSVIGSHG
jgi:hypothetical protein